MKDYWFQKEAIYSIYNYYGNGGRGNTLIGLPTGTGKSHVQSGFIHGAMFAWPSQRFLCLAHVKELVQQNASKLLEAWPTAPVGIYSAGLKRKDYLQPVVFGTSASVRNRPEKFGHRDILFIDECHMVSPEAETTYQKIINVLKQINPALKVVGLTATYYRLGMGKLTDGGIFDEVIYDMTNREGFARLIADGYLCPLIPRKTSYELDTSSVGIAKGDYKQGELQAAVDKKDITYQALLELCQLGADRRSWLIFATGVKHAENIAEMLRGFGIPSAAVHSKLSNGERDRAVAEFKAGKLRCVVNNNVLTTGFDHPPIDLIGMLRPTVSCSLHVQMAGRGTRVCEGKTNCLFLDFAGNTSRLGPIDDPQIPKKRGSRGGDAPVKVCEVCGTYNHISARECMVCETPFPKIEKLSKHASDKELLSTEAPVVETHEVSSIVYHDHLKPGSPMSMRVTYYCDGGLNAYREWIHFERDGLQGHKAKEWFLARYNGQNPTPGKLPFKTTIEALKLTEHLTVPRAIRVWVNKKHPEIISYDF